VPAAAATVAPTTAASTAPIVEGPERGLTVPADAGIPRIDPGARAESGSLPEKLGRRIRNELRQKLGARVALPGVLHVPTPDGGGLVYAVYEMSRFEACVGRGKARESCRDEVQMGDACTDRGLVRATYGPTPPGVPADRGGVLTLSEPRPLGGLCMLSSVLEVWRGDADGDGQAEVRVDLVTSTPAREMRSGQRNDEYRRDVRVFREDLQPEIEIELATWIDGVIPDATMDSTAGRITWHDENGDGHADVVVETLSYSPHCNSPDDTGWVDGRSDTCNEGERYEPERRVLLFDPSKDEWSSLTAS
jgi:hypothetical protein